MRREEQEERAAQFEDGGLVAGRHGDIDHALEQPGARRHREGAEEGEAEAASALGVRVALVRIGVVLDREGGALPKMALPVRWCAGSKLGAGTQGLSWIHIDDLVAILIEAARNPAWSGAFNGTAPQPLSNEAFMQLIAQRLRRPLLPVPGFLTALATRLLLGEMAEALLLQGAFVLPARSQALGFQFRFPTAKAALEDLL